MTTTTTKTKIMQIVDDQKRMKHPMVIDEMEDNTMDATTKVQQNLQQQDATKTLNKNNNMDRMTTYQNDSPKKIQHPEKIGTVGTLLSDNPCWGSFEECSLQHLLHCIETKKRNNTNNNDNHDNNKKQNHITGPNCSGGGGDGGSSNHNRNIILYESDHYMVVNKPPDLRMDGPYPATVHKLLTYYYPSPTLLQQVQVQLQKIQLQVEETTTRVSTTSTATSTDMEDDDGMENNSRTTLLSSNSSNLLCDIITKQYHYYPDMIDNTLRPCHQLDYATSGVLLIARTKHAANRARMAFENRTVQKQYTAVLSGHVSVQQLITKKIFSSQKQHQSRNNNNNTTQEEMKTESNDMKTTEIPCYTKKELHSIMEQLEYRYKRKRTKDGMKNDRDRIRGKENHKKWNVPTFVGYLPVHAFLQQIQKYLKQIGYTTTTTTTTNKNTNNNNASCMKKEFMKNQLQQQKQKPKEESDSTESVNSAKIPISTATDDTKKKTTQQQQQEKKMKWSCSSNSSSSTNGSTDTEKKYHKTITNGKEAVVVLTASQWEEVFCTIQQQQQQQDENDSDDGAGSNSTNNNDNTSHSKSSSLSSIDNNEMLLQFIVSTTWQEVKNNLPLKERLQRGVDLYNYLLYHNTINMKKEKESQNTNTIRSNNNNNNNTTNDHLHVRDMMSNHETDGNDTKPNPTHDISAFPMMDGLPTIFRVIDDDDNDDNDNNHSEDRGVDNDTAIRESFYIAAPLAEPLDKSHFAMLIHQSYANEQICPQLSAVRNHSTDTTNTWPIQYEKNHKNEINNASKVYYDFKPSLTKCTILHQTYWQNPVVEEEVDTNLGDVVEDDGPAKHTSTRSYYPVTTVLLEPRTGRRHQLRVHTALIGYPILGDQTYQRSMDHGHVGSTNVSSFDMTNTTTNEQDGSLLKRSHVDRLCLHSHRLEVRLLDNSRSSSSSCSSCSSINGNKGRRTDESSSSLPETRLKVVSKNPFQLDPQDKNKLIISMF